MLENQQTSTTSILLLHILFQDSFLSPSLSLSRCLSACTSIYLLTLDALLEVTQRPHHSDCLKTKHQQRVSSLNSVTTKHVDVNRALLLAKEQQLKCFLLTFHSHAYRFSFHEFWANSCRRLISRKMDEFSREKCLTRPFKEKKYNSRVPIILGLVFLKNILQKCRATRSTDIHRFVHGKQSIIMTKKKTRQDFDWV